MRRPAPLPTPADPPEPERSTSDRPLPVARIPRRVAAPPEVTEVPSGPVPAASGITSGDAAQASAAVAVPSEAETIPLERLASSGESPQSQDSGAESVGADPGSGSRAERPGDREGDVIGKGAAISPRDLWRATRARRRALRSEIRRFTARTRRRRWIWLGGLGAVLALVLGSVAVAYSPLFAVERIRVEGTVALDPAVVEQALAGQLGRPLAAVDRSAVKAALTPFPMIETYVLEARPPHDLTVRILERTPVGVFATPAGYTLVDAAGVVLSTTPDVPAGHPVLDITGGASSRAFTSAGLVVRSLPEHVRAQLTEVTASTVDDVTLTLAGGARVMWGSAEDSVLKAVVLDQVMQVRPPGDVWYYDVSSPEAVVVG